MATTEPGGPRVTVVIPVYNAAPHLTACLDSLSDQRLGGGGLQVVAVDDGSTDGSDAILDAAAGSRPWLEVVHEPNSGWPGRPRNVGLARATGRYVFFLDADDYLAPGALAILADYADQLGADVVLPQLVSVGANPPPLHRHAASRPRAGVVEAFESLMPQALFRRELLERWNIRFPEGHVRLEDGIFVTQAYLHADRLAIRADEEHYFKRHGTANISHTPGPPANYLRSLAVMAGLVHTYCDDARTRDTIIQRLWQLKGLNRVRPDKVDQFTLHRLRRWVRALSAFCHLYVSQDIQSRLPPLERLQTAFLRRRDPEAVRHLGLVIGGIEELRLVQRGVQLSLESAGERPRDVTGLVGPGDGLPVEVRPE